MVAVLVLWRQPRFAREPSLPAGFGTGIVSGVLNGSTGFAGPPVILYFLSTHDSVPVIRASLMMYFFFSTGGTLVYDAMRGLIGSHVLLLDSHLLSGALRSETGWAIAASTAVRRQPIAAWRWASCWSWPCSPSGRSLYDEL